jgi:hypothetical protein
MTLCSSHQFGALQSLVTSQQSVILEALKEVGKPCDNSKQARKQAIVLDCSTSDYFAFGLVLSSSLTKKPTERDRENRKRVKGKRKKKRSPTTTGNKIERERARTASAEGEQIETEIINNNNRRKQDREIERANRKRQGRRERNRDYQQQQETRKSDHLRSVQSLAIVAEIGAAAVHLG